MKWKIATASVVTAAAIMTAPVAGAAPGNGKGKGNGHTGTRNTIGQTISQIAKSGGGSAGILSALSGFKPNNTGLAKALQNALKPKPTPTPDTETDTVTPSA